VRVSVAEAIRLLKDEPKSNAAQYESKTSGFSLELALFCGMILASHCDGFSGSRLDRFMSSLCRELDFCANFESYEYSFKFPGDFPASIRQRKIPYCSPMACSSWNVDLVRDIEKIMNNSKPVLGTVYPSIHNNSRVDCAMLCHTDSEDFSPVILGECKLHNRNIDRSTLLNVIGKFESFSTGNFFLVTCFKLAAVEGTFCKDCQNIEKPAKITKMGSSTYQEEDAVVKNIDRFESLKLNNENIESDLEKNQMQRSDCIGCRYCLWKIKKTMLEDKVTYSCVKLNNFQNVGAIRHVILLELSELYTGKIPFDQYTSCFR
jgi:hypothetical protein